MVNRVPGPSFVGPRGRLRVLPLLAVFHRPAGIVQRVRWLYLVLCVLSLLLGLPLTLVSAGATGLGQLILTLSSGVFLLLLWLTRYLSNRASRVLDVLDAVGLTVFALAYPRPEAVLPVFFAVVWFVSLDGSTSRARARCGLICGGMLAVPLSETMLGNVGAVSAAPFVITIPLIVLTTAIARTLAGHLAAREQAGRRDAALVTLGSSLLGTTKAELVVECAWVACQEITAATPGLRTIVVLRRADMLRVDRSAGSFATTPVLLPAALAEQVGVSGITALPPIRQLDDAAGSTCTWLSICLPLRDSGWLLLGSPSAISEDVLASVRSVVNELALALRTTAAHEQLTSQAQTDSLTGLANRAAFTSALTDALAGPTRARTAVLFLDLDDFKDVNDVLGHGAGDSLLREVGVRLRQLTRPGDICARLGGDEFAVILTDTTQELATAVAERLVRAVAAPVHVADRVTQVGASVGVAYATGASTVEQLVHSADIAMYAAKANGKNRIQVFQDGLLKGRAADTLETQLAVAVASGQFVVYYQPVLSLATMRATAVEALVRWRHPSRGLLQPAEFIAQAEASGAILDIGAFVLRQACSDAVGWQRDHPQTHLALHVNVSAVQLDDDEFLALVEECLADSHLPPDRLVLEITETAVLNSPFAIERLKVLSARGVGIAIDDFGTGYSALTTLRSLPLDLVKIDKSFVAGIATNPADRAVIDAVVQMSSRLGLHTIAEGVERLDQQQFLQSSGTDSVQGYLYSRALPATEFQTWLTGHLAAQEHDSSQAADVVPLRPTRTA